MSDQSAAAAQAMGIPEDLVNRSAKARAAETGGDVEAIIAAWAEGGSAPAGAPPPPPEPTATVEDDTTIEPASEPTPAPSPDDVSTAPSPSAPQTVAPVPAPTTVSPEEALDYDVVISVPTAGLKERTATTIPQWLVAALLIAPIFGLLYLASNGTADASCTEQGVVLKVDRATGTLVNCDGSEFAGRGGGAAGAGQFIALGSELYTTCAGCHGANGGGGTGPAFGGVLSTFSSCTDHIEWVRLGSAGFQAAGNSTYGDLAKSIAGGMPGFPNLTDEEIASVVSFERIRFGGGNADEVVTDCGLVEAAPVAPADGAPPPDGAPAETVPPTEG